MMDSNRPDALAALQPDGISRREIVLRIGAGGLAVALLELAMLQKVLYELAYELNNRPDWVSIPLRGLLELLGARGSSSATDPAPDRATDPAPATADA